MGGSHGSVDEVAQLLGYCAVSPGKRQCWWWRHRNPVKGWQLFTNQYGVTSQRTWIFINSTVKASCLVFSSSESFYVQEISARKNMRKFSMKNCKLTIA